MKKTKEECERDPEGHEYAMIYNEGTTCMNCGHHRTYDEDLRDAQRIYDKAMANPRKFEVPYFAAYRIGQANGAMAERRRRDEEDERIARVTARIEAQLREMEEEEWPGEIDAKEKL